jgi:hypothetical protein
VETLLRTIDRYAGRKRAERWRRYATLLREQARAASDGADTEATDAAAGELASLMNELGLTSDQVREHARAVEDEPRLAATAAGAEAHQAEITVAMQALHDTRERVKAARADWDARLRDAERRVGTAQSEKEAATAAAEQLVRVRSDYAFLFVGQPPALPRIAHAAWPASIDDRLLSLDPGAVYTPAELEEQFGASLKAMRAGEVPATPDGNYLGSLVLAWAREARRRIRIARRRVLAGVVLPPISPAELAQFRPLDTYDQQQIAEICPGLTDRVRVGRVNGDMVVRLARVAIEKSDAARRELSTMDAEDAKDGDSLPPPPAAAAPVEEAADNEDGGRWDDEDVDRPGGEEEDGGGSGAVDVAEVLQGLQSDPGAAPAATAPTRAATTTATTTPSRRRGR